MAFLEPDDLPENPLNLCGYDLVAIRGVNFSLLGRKQLGALEAWVRAGGSLFVAPGGVLDPHHLEFLNRFALPAETGPLGVNSQGRLMPLPTVDRIVLARRDLGRVAVYLGGEDLEPDFESSAWRRLVAFLWKVRKDQIATIVKSSQWDKQQIEAQRAERMQRNRVGIPTCHSTKWSSP